MEVTSAEARNLYKEAGAEVDNAQELVKLSPEMVMGLLKTVPPEFTLTPTNPDRALTIGGNHIHFGMVSGAPMCIAIKGAPGWQFCRLQKFYQIGPVF